MVAITIKNLPDDLYDRLKSAAKAHHRSINGEVIAAIERSVGVERVDPEQRLAAVRALRAELDLPVLDPGEIAEAIRQGRP